MWGAATKECMAFWEGGSETRGGYRYCYCVLCCDPLLPLAACIGPSPTGCWLGGRGRAVRGMGLLSPALTALTRCLAAVRARLALRCLPTGVGVGWVVWVATVQFLLLLTLPMVPGATELSQLEIIRLSNVALMIVSGSRLG